MDIKLKQNNDNLNWKAHFWQVLWLFDQSAFNITHILTTGIDSTSLTILINVCASSSKSGTNWPWSMNHWLINWKLDFLWFKQVYVSYTIDKDFTESNLHEGLNFTEILISRFQGNCEYSENKILAKISCYTVYDNKPTARIWILRPVSAS